MLRLRSAKFSALVLVLAVVLGLGDGLKLERYLKADELAPEPVVQSSLLRRQPRFFFRSTTTTTVTATVSTSAACYASVGIVGVCGAGRKRRDLDLPAIVDQPIASGEKDDSALKKAITAALINPTSASSRQDKMMDLNQVKLYSSHHEAMDPADPRFFFYYTTTITTLSTTVTTTTGTTTFTITSCLPTSFAYAACPAAG